MTETGSERTAAGRAVFEKLNRAFGHGQIRGSPDVAAKCRRGRVAGAPSSGVHEILENGACEKSEPEECPHPDTAPQGVGDGGRVNFAAGSISVRPAATPAN